MSDVACYYKFEIEIDAEQKASIEKAMEHLPVYRWQQEAIEDGWLNVRGEVDADGNTSEEVAEHIAQSVWQAIGGYCDLEIRLRFVQELMQDDVFLFYEDDYQRIEEKTDE